MACPLCNDTGDQRYWEGRWRDADAEIAKLRARLPGGMEHCTILFKECDVGHGWLTATNWVQHGCPHCKIAKLRAALERSVIAINDWLHQYAGDVCNEESVAESAARVGEYGTIGYIADVLEQNRCALEQIGEKT